MSRRSWADGLTPFLLHIESYLVYEKGHKVGHCHQLRLPLVHVLLSMAGSKPRDDVNLSLFSQFLQACHQPLIVNKGRIISRSILCSMYDLKQSIQVD